MIQQRSDSLVTMDQDSSLAENRAMRSPLAMTLKARLNPDKTRLAVLSGSARESIMNHGSERAGMSSRVLMGATMAAGLTMDFPTEISPAVHQIPLLHLLNGRRQILDASRP